jgi:hypothetical protein
LWLSLRLCSLRPRDDGLQTIGRVLLIAAIELRHNGGENGIAALLQRRRRHLPLPGRQQLLGRHGFGGFLAGVEVFARARRCRRRLLAACSRQHLRKLSQ